MSTKEIVYVVVTGGFGSDVVGELVHPDREQLWGHMSSSQGWLRRDLTDGFEDRREKLAAMFPDGYEVVEVGLDDPLPEPIAHLYGAPGVSDE